MNPFLRKAVIGGIFAALLVGVGTYTIGLVTGSEAMHLFSTTLSRFKTLCNTVILSSSTILALMLTLLSLSRSANTKLNHEHYHRVLTLAKVVSILIVVAVMALLLLNLPVDDNSQVPDSWYRIIYYLSLGLAAIIGGGFVAVISMLYSTIANVILIIGYNKENHPLVQGEEARKQSDQQHKKNS